MNIKCVFLSPLKVLFSHNLNIIHTYTNNDLKIIKKDWEQGGGHKLLPNNHTNITTIFAIQVWLN